MKLIIGFEQSKGEFTPRGESDVIKYDNIKIYTAETSEFKNGGVIPDRYPVKIRTSDFNDLLMNLGINQSQLVGSQFKQALFDNYGHFVSFVEFTVKH